MRSISNIFRTNNNRRRKPFGISSNFTLNKSLCRVKIRESANREFALDWNQTWARLTFMSPGPVACCFLIEQHVQYCR